MNKEERTIEIRQLPGCADELYRLVAPLVMDPAVIKQNLGYPFRTSDRYLWYVALDKRERVLGFIPVERRRASVIINNYYVAKHDPEVLSALLQAVVDTAEPTRELLSLTLNDDCQTFGEQGFVPYLVLKKYVKMKWRGNVDGQDDAPAQAAPAITAGAPDAPVVKRRPGRSRKQKADDR